MGGLALVTLFTIRNRAHLIYVAAVIALGQWELTRVLEERSIRLPLIPTTHAAASSCWGWPVPRRAPADARAGLTN